MDHSANSLIRLSERRFTTAEVVKLSGVTDKDLRNWVAPPRNTLPIGERQFGRLTFNLLDAIQLAAMVDLTKRVPLKPSAAVSVAADVRRQVTERTPNGIADPNTIPGSLAMTLAFIDGKPRVGVVDLNQPEHTDCGSTWRRARVVLPIAALVTDVLSRLTQLCQEGRE